MSQDHQDPSAADDQPSAPTAAGFDTEFATVAGSPGVRRVWQQATPDLPPEIEPYSFVSVALLGHLADALALSPGMTLVDLGCGRGGPGLWLAQSHGTLLIGVDFSAVAVQQATARAALFGLADRVRFVVGDLAATGLADGTADAVVAIDALHFAADPTAAAREGLRLLRPGGRLVLTNWQPRSPADSRLPSRLRIDWAATLGSAGFAEVRVESRPEWHELFTRVFQVALELGDPGEDVGLASLQDEARRALPMAQLVDRLLAQRPAPIANQQLTALASERGDPLLAKPDRAVSLPAMARNGAARGCCGVVRGCPLKTGRAVVNGTLVARPVGRPGTDWRRWVLR